jgi:hypothetical protein
VCGLPARQRAVVVAILGRSERRAIAAGSSAPHQNSPPRCGSATPPRTPRWSLFVSLSKPASNGSKAAPSRPTSGKHSPIPPSPAHPRPIGQAPLSPHDLRPVSSSRASSAEPMRAPTRDHSRSSRNNPLPASTSKRSSRHASRHTVRTDHASLVRRFVTLPPVGVGMMRDWLGGDRQAL